MTSRTTLSLAEQIATAQEWWREAGVDLAYTDDAQAWLAAVSAEESGPVSPADVSPAPRHPAIGGDPSAWPRDLAEFQRWWIADASLDAGGTHPRIAPRGQEGAPLAILVPMPEAGDTDALLSGPQGGLIAAMAGALGLMPDELYFASALRRHTEMPDWSALRSGGLGEVLLHHLALAAPQRLLVLGRDVLSLLENDPAQSAPAISEIAIQGRQLPLLASYQPARLLQRTQWRAGLWQHLLEWTEGDTRR
jgi:DNA polymerase